MTFRSRAVGRMRFNVQSALLPPPLSARMKGVGVVASMAGGT
jgi:hypothetical protein